MSSEWQDAYERILREVQAEMPDADDATQYQEYRRRCIVWKHEHGIEVGE